MNKEKIEAMNQLIDAVDSFMKKRGLETEFFNFCVEHHPDFANFMLKLGMVSIQGSNQKVKQGES